MTLIECGFEHPVHHGVGVEVLTYRELARRAPVEVLTQPHRIDFHQLILVRNATLTATVDFGEVSCVPGTLLHVRPGQVQRLPVGARGEVPGHLEADMVLFTPAFPPQSPQLASVVNDPFGQAAFALPPDDADAMGRLIEELRAESRQLEQEASDVTLEVVRYLLAAILLRVARLGTLGERSASGAHFHRFRRELEQSYGALRSAQGYAERIGCSLKTLNGACQQASGKTAKELIDERVVLEAKRLLAHTDISVSAIGHRLNFSEPTNFGKYFAARVGVTPMQFRAAQRRSDDSLRATTRLTLSM